jgi:hypothetical protein
MHAAARAVVISAAGVGGAALIRQMVPRIGSLAHEQRREEQQRRQ